MITIRYNKQTGEVLMVSEIDAPKEGDLYVDALPVTPQTEPPYYAELVVRNGKAEWVIKEAEMPKEEPPTYEEPAPPTNEEISQMRQQAYEAECDPYLVAYQGYLVEGDEAKAESARKAYLKAKAEVRARLPYAEGNQ